MARMKAHLQSKALGWFLFVFIAVTAQLIGRVQGQVAPPTRLRYTVVDHDSVQISWKAPKGQFDGYKLLVTPNAGGKTNELTLQNNANKAIIQGLIPDQSYTVQIIAFAKDQESKAAQGQFRIKDIEKKKETSGKPKVKDVGKLKPTVPPEDPENLPFPKVEGQNLLGIGEVEMKSVMPEFSDKANITAYLETRREYYPGK